MNSLERHPVALSAGVVVAIAAIGVTLHLVFAGVGSVLVRLLISAAVMSVSLAIGVYVASRLGWRRSGFRFDLDPAGRRSLWLLILPVLGAGIVFQFRASSVSGGTFFLLGGLAILVALHEETWFRGVILTVLAARGPLPAVVASAVLFGIGHSLNALTTSATPRAVAYQVISATLIGILFGTVRLKTGMIWPSVIVHALVDWASFAALYPQIVPREPRLEAVIGGILVYGALSAAALWSLRSRPRRAGANLAAD
jgi:membrane protease YdiL (CAAX protease family)